MKIVIEVPHEFEQHFKEDRFEDSLERVAYDAMDNLERINANRSSDYGLSGRYDLEVIQMLQEAIKNGTPLPAVHGDLIDINELLDQIFLDDTEENRMYNVGEIITLEDIDRLDVIIPAEREVIQND